LFIPQVIYEKEPGGMIGVDRAKLKTPQKNLSQCHVVHHKSYMN
jgi:hypothetical protein